MSDSFPVVISLIDFHSKTTLSSLSTSLNSSNCLHHQQDVLFFGLKKHWLETSKARLKFLHTKQDYMMIMEYYPSMFTDFPIESSSIKQMLGSDEEFMSKAVMYCGKILDIASPELREKLALKAVQHDGLAIEYLDDDEIDHEIMLEAVKQNGLALSCFAEASFAVCKEAVKNDASAYEFVFQLGHGCSELDELASIEDPYRYSNEMEEYIREDVAKYVALHGSTEYLATAYGNVDMNFLKRLTREQPELINQFGSWETNIDDERDELERIAVKYSQNPLDKWLPYNVDVEHYCKIVSHCGEMLFYAKNQTREMVLLAVKNNGEAIQYANEEFLEDREIILESIKTFPFAIQYTQELYADRDFILECVKENGEILSYIWEDYGDDHEVVLNAVRNYGLALEYASDDLQKDREIVLEAVSNNEKALIYADYELQHDWEVLSKTISTPINAIEYIMKREDEIKKANLLERDNIPVIVERLNFDGPVDRTMLLNAIKKRSILFSQVPEEMKVDRDFILEAAKINGFVLQHLSETFRDDLEIVREAVKNNSHCIGYASDRLKLNWRLRKLVKELDEREFKDWFDYWDERSKEYDIPKPKRYREETKDFDEDVDFLGEEYDEEYLTSEDEDESHLKKRKTEELPDNVE